MPLSITPEAAIEPTRIVSSNHLVSAKSPELSEFEYGMIVAWHAFTLDDALHVGRGLRGHDHHRRAGAAPCHPPRHRQAPCRRLFRSQRGGHPRGVVFAQKLASLGSSPAPASGQKEPSFRRPPRAGCHACYRTLRGPADAGLLRQRGRERRIWPNSRVRRVPCRAATTRRPARLRPPACEPCHDTRMPRLRRHRLHRGIRKSHQPALLAAVIALDAAILRHPRRPCARRRDRDGPDLPLADRHLRSATATSRDPRVPRSPGCSKNPRCGGRRGPSGGVCRYATAARPARPRACRRGQRPGVERGGGPASGRRVPRFTCSASCPAFLSWASCPCRSRSCYAAASRGFGCPPAA